MAGEASIDLGATIILLGAAVAAVPLSRRLGLGSVLGYLAAGLVIGPFGLSLIDDPVTLLHVAELGVVMFLFIIGLEMRPAKLWALRREIFGLGAAQVLFCGALLSVLAMLGGFSAPVAIVGAMGFVLSSTAVIMRMLEERGETPTPAGQRAISILLLEDLSIVPLLAMVALFAAFAGGIAAGEQPILLSISIALAAVAALIAIGLWLLNPMFAILARSGAREVLTAAALLVVLGTAFAMEQVGLSMAMGAFLAGVLLSESAFRHQLEADIDPFRGILLGLFFLSVGMALDLSVVAAEWRLVIAGVVLAMLVKAFGIYATARLFGASSAEAVQRAALFAQGGEFAFVLYAAALGAGIFDPPTAALMTAIVILSMALTPLLLPIVERLAPRPTASMEGVEAASGLKGKVLFIGFGRFGQVVSQPLLARCVELSLIEVDVEMIQAAGNFGFKVYYGDGTRLDVLRASGASKAEAILVCVDKPEVADKIVQICKAEFPLAKLYVRAFDRGHSLRLIQAGVDYQVRETFESALLFGREVLVGLGHAAEVAEEAIEDVRRRDSERLDLQLAGGLSAGRWLLRGNMRTPEPEPLMTPPRGTRAAEPPAAGQIDAGAAPKEPIG
jgi:glutathione-regulated potassium-efflux system protein KefB